MVEWSQDQKHGSEGSRTGKWKLYYDEVTEKVSDDPSGLLELECLCRILTNQNMRTKTLYHCIRSLYA